MALNLRQIVAVFLAGVMCLGSAAAAGADTLPEQQAFQTEKTISAEPVGNAEEDIPGVYDPYAGVKMRIGLAYPGNSTGALVHANLIRADISQVTGYRLGIYDEKMDFVSLASAQEASVSVVKTTNIYRVGENYYDAKPSGNYELLGCYHRQLPLSFTTWEEAKAAADNTWNGFVCWVDGVYYVRSGSYATVDEAKAAADAEPDTNWSVVYTSVYGVNVVKTGTCQILFQFDGGAAKSLAVAPGAESGKGAVTWFKGFKYQGDFRCERVGGGNIVVVNIVDVDTYVKGVVPYESNKLWPLETLKAQALCAKNYCLINRNKHNAYNFDLCNTTECQVYYGLGSNKETFQPSALSDQAVDEIKGQYVWYGEKLAHTYFYSSNGGGSEDSSKVWGSNQKSYPYLLGVVDPYEATVADKIPSYRFSKTFTNDQLTEILRTKGYATNTSVVDFQVTEYSKTGNALTMKFTYENGKSNTFASSSSSWLRNKLGCRSMHFTVTGAGEELSDECAVNNATGERISNFTGLYALNAAGELVQLEQRMPYVITGAGEISVAGKTTVVPNGTYVIKGTGWGHNVGYSQWGGYAMAKQGFNAKEIIEFYFTGVKVGAKQSDK